MFSGAQISLYPMTDDFVDVITRSLEVLAPYRDRLRMETDDISTLIVGPPEVLFPALRDLFVAAAASGKHCVLSAAISRGCPGEPDDPICATVSIGGLGAPLDQRKAEALKAVAGSVHMDRPVAAQFSLYVMGSNDHMDEIYGCIEFLRDSGVFDRSKHFCSRLCGDAGAVFAALGEAFCRFGPPEGHVTLDVTVSANSPTIA